jgi:transposase
VRAELAVRDTLVRTRTRYVGLLKALLRRDGHRLPSGSPEHTAVTVAALPVSPTLAAELAPLLALLPALHTEIAAVDQRLATCLAANPVVQRLATAPAVGPVTATAFVATLDDITRFATAHQVEAYLGLVPSERSSGERQRRGRITQAGHTRVRWLLVEAAWRILRSPRLEAAALRAWAERIALRRGKHIAVVALARRLAGILYAMWRDGTPDQPRRVPRTAAAA